MDYEFLTLLENLNDWLDWLMLWYGDNTEGLEEPKEFPCYVIDELVAYVDKDEKDDFKGEPLFWPHFLYLNDVKQMLDNLEV